MPRKQTVLIRRQIMRDLKDLKPYLYSQSLITGSQYIKFQNENLRSIRVSDHRGIRKYKYKWNVIIGGQTRIKMDRGTERHFYSEDALHQLYGDIRQLASDLRGDWIKWSEPSL